MDKTHWLVFSDNTKHPYHIVFSKRAKHVRVKLSNQGDLSVTLPKGVALRHAHEFLHSRVHWVEKHLQEIPATEPMQRPQQLNLELLGELWKIDYISTMAENVELHEEEDFQLSIVGNINDLSLVKQVILMWCKKKALSVFHALLQECAEAYGFHYNRLSIRAQKTRWGSCSSDKNINLNCKLLFMPDEIVRYVFIHELCHTIEMNHSSDFWALVDECDSDYKIHRKQLKQKSCDIFSNVFWH